MTDKEYHKQNLENIFDSASHSPVFKSNPKFNIGDFSKLVPYISYGDVMNYKYIIRGRPLGMHNSFDAEDRCIIVQYDNIEDLINDNWRLD